MTFPEMKESKTRLKHTLNTKPIILWVIKKFTTFCMKELMKSVVSGALLFHCNLSR